MKLRTHFLLFITIFAFEFTRVVGNFGDTAPDITDLLEVHNIAFNVAHGRGYQFDWGDPVWLGSLHPLGAKNNLDFIRARRSAHTTFFRPPLTPLIVAAMVKLFPKHSFAAWRTFDCAAFSAGACLLCDIAYTSGSLLGLGTMVLLLLFDPLLRIFVPGCWTEGVAFDLLSAILWLVVNPRRLRFQWYLLICGICVGLLCLDRAVFVLMILPLCVLLSAARFRTASIRFKTAGMILVVCLLVQAPWWVRNITVSGRFLPLGTQGGFNLPDQYGDVPMTQPIWTGTGMAIAWTPLVIKDSDIRLPPGFTAEELEHLSAGNRRMQALLIATFCTSRDSEIAVNDRGVQAARVWISQHYEQIPRLMSSKALALIQYFHPLIIRSILLGITAVVLLQKGRRVLLYASLITAFYVLAIMVTHVVLARFLIPILPMLFLANALGVSAIIRLFANGIRFVHRRR